MAADMDRSPCKTFTGESHDELKRLEVPQSWGGMSQMAATSRIQNYHTFLPCGCRLKKKKKITYASTNH